MLSREKALVVAFILTLFAFNLNALVKGKIEVNKAEAWKLWIFHVEKAYHNPITKETYCRDNGFTCIWVDL